MAYEANQTYNGTLVAGEDLTNHQFKAVKVGAGGAVFLAAAGDGIYGVNRGKAPVGRAANVVLTGATKVKAGGTIAAGAILGVGALGVFVTWTAGAKVGQALTAAVSGDIFTANLSFAAA